MQEIPRRLEDLGTNAGIPEFFRQKSELEKHDEKNGKNGEKRNDWTFIELFPGEKSPEKL